MVFLELRRDSRVTTGISGFLLGWPWALTGESQGVGAGGAHQPLGQGRLPRRDSARCGSAGQLSDTGEHPSGSRRLGAAQDVDTHPKVGTEFLEPGGAGVQWRKCAGPQLPCLHPRGWGSVVCDSQFMAASGDWAPPGGRGAGHQPQLRQSHCRPARGVWGPPGGWPTGVPAPV